MAEKEFCLHGRADAGRPVRHWFSANDPEDAGKVAARYLDARGLELTRLEQHSKKRRGKSDIVIIPVPGH